MAKQQDMKMIVELSEYDRVLIRQLIDRLANPVPPPLPFPGNNPAPQWWQNPVMGVSKAPHNPNQIVIN